MAEIRSVALVGPSGIGRIHAREFHRAGVPVTAVLASTYESSQAAADDLTKQFGTVVHAFRSLEDLASTDIDAAVVCSPPAVHLEAIDAFLNVGKYVLCEKPLFWKDGLSPSEVSETCARLASRAEGRLVVNTNNTWFPEIWFKRYGKPANIRRFGFHFHTNGPFRDAAIGTDLLPHAISVLLEILNEQCLEDTPVNIVKTVRDDRFVCRFEFGGVNCDIDLRQGPDIPRAFGFRVDDTSVERIQRIVDDKYKVFLAPADRGRDAIQVADPFEISIRRFIEGVASKKRFDTEMARAVKVMNMMTEIIVAP